MREYIYNVTLDVLERVEKNGRVSSIPSCTPVQGRDGRATTTTHKYGPRIITFTNGLNEDGIVSSHNETESSVVSIDDHYPRMRIGMAGVTAANQAAVDGRRAVLRRRAPLKLWRTSLESGPVRLVQPGKQREREHFWDVIEI